MVRRYLLHFVILAVILALIGLGVWEVLRNWVLDSTQWMLVFMTWPIMFGWYGMYFRECRR